VDSVRALYVGVVAPPGPAYSAPNDLAGETARVSVEAPASKMQSNDPKSEENKGLTHHYAKH
jgi:hypothetical protein